MARRDSDTASYTGFGSELEKLNAARDRKSFILSEALKHGVTRATFAGMLSTGAVFLANNFHKGFRTKLGVSGKTALAFTPVAFTFLVATVGCCCPRQISFTVGSKWKARVTDFNLVYALALLPCRPTCEKEDRISFPDQEKVRAFDRSRFEEVRKRRAAAAAAREKQTPPPTPGSATAFSPAFSSSSSSSFAPASVCMHEARVFAPSSKRLVGMTEDERRDRELARKLVEYEKREKARRGPNLQLYAPLLYAPLIPLTRIALRGRVSPKTLVSACFLSVFLSFSLFRYLSHHLPLLPFSL